ncbi:carbohydrate-binding protein [Streptomyces polyrhachis]|uniref:Carbohydrate-binding protein n=1 Tax=Streptomyces polyrhachis TaxID=1282885 RepID=A0ABW2GD55_9ACTN
MTDGYSGGPGGQPTADDDPFAHLYRREGGAPAEETAPISHAPGVPRTSYNQVRTVGERQYGQPAPHYAAPETYGGPGARPQPEPGDGYGPGPGHGGGRRGAGGGGGGLQGNPLLLGAIAVVATVVIAIGAAMLFSKDDEKKDAGPATTASAPAGEAKKKQDGKDKDAAKPKLSPPLDAAKAVLAGGTVLAGDIPGAKSAGGQYIAGITAPGASATWTVEVPAAGSYHVYVDYGVPGKDQALTLTVNGEAQTRKLNMKNFANAKAGEWDKGWTYTYALADLKAGTNTIALSCQPGDTCEVNLDRLEVRAGER